MQDVGEWLISHDLEFNMNDNELVQSVLYDYNNIASLEEIEEEKILSMLLILHYKQV